MDNERSSQIVIAGVEAAMDEIKHFLNSCPTIDREFQMLQTQ